MWVTLKRYEENELGAITVDWVILTAALVGIAVAVMFVISSGLNAASNSSSQNVSSAGSSMAGLINSTDPAAVRGTYVVGNQRSYRSGFRKVARRAASQRPNTALKSYNHIYVEYLNEPSQKKLDALAGAEQALIDNGITIPNGNITAVAFQNGAAPVSEPRD